MKVNKGKQKVGLSEINLTSLVDVCLTLVIIFMVTSPLVMQSAIKVSTPSLEKAAAETKKTELKAEVHLKPEGVLQLNGKQIENEVFADSLRSLLAASKDKLVVISADPDVIHDRLIAVMDEAKQCGAEKLSLVRRK